MNPEILKANILDILRSEAALTENPDIQLFAQQLAQKINELT